jgi:hypothetical protein
MIFYARGGRALADIEANLARSDPVLAAHFELFNIRYRRTPVAQERQPSQQVRSKKPIAIALLPLAVLLLSWYAVTGGGHGTARGCPTAAVAMCPASQTSGRAAGASTLQETGHSAHQEMGPRASAIQTRQTPP